MTRLREVSQNATLHRACILRLETDISGLINAVLRCNDWQLLLKTLSTITISVHKIRVSWRDINENLSSQLHYLACYVSFGFEPIRAEKISVHATYGHRHKEGQYFVITVAYYWPLLQCVTATWLTITEPSSLSSTNTMAANNHTPSPSTTNL